jgi:murein DD-endopeptidase MepM/ murein hydrolase activator NlpD
MQRHTSSYPVRIISRSAAKRRARRIGWFIIGTTFGIGCASALTPILTKTPWSEPAILAQHTAPALPPEAVATKLAKLVPAAGKIAAKPLSLASMDPVVEKPAVAPPPVTAPVAAAPSAPARAYPVALNLKVENGDTLLNILTDTGVSYEEAHNAVESVKKIYNPKKLDIGQNVSVILNKGKDTADMPVIASLKLPISPTASVEVKRSQGTADNGFAAKKVNAPTERRLARAGGRIDSSLYETGVSSGLPPALLSEMINAYSYDVDFQREIQPGDTMDALFERIQTKEGAVAGHGNLIYAELDLGDRTLKIFRYVDKGGNADYYNEKGESIRKALLRTPINGAKITSGFGMRNHPILGYSKMHRGVDFGAATGTPIYAAGDGVVEFVGVKGGYGNYIRVKHTDKYASAYGHISRFATGVAPGRKVKQGQIIAYVGATGMATGPHLHYEILVNNEQVNPAGVKFKTGNVLQGKELLAFRKNMEQIHAQVIAAPRDKTTIAMADTGNATN